MGKTFLLGVGCQKGGTTWLHQYLKSNPEVNLGFAKEYHVFDALYLDSCNSFLQEKIGELRQAVLDANIMSADENLLRHLDFYRNTKNYFDYFDYLHSQSNHISLVGDITPSYSGLPIEAFQHIKDNAELKGFDVRVIFLLRDPFERSWSQLRMGRRNKAKDNPNVTFAMDEINGLKGFYKDEQCEFRTRYERTIANLESVFDSKNIHYEFYESFFSEQSIQKIASFLDIPFITPDFGKQINASPKQNDKVEPEVVREVVQFYRETYDFCQARFGNSFINQLWPNTQYL